jgi:integrase
MLTDTALRNLKPRDLPYKVTDRDGMYALVTTTGSISFRCDYRLNGRRETLVIGRYNPRGLTLALARTKCLEARAAVARGESPAQAKRSAKVRLNIGTFCDYAEKWFREANLSASTKAMRRFVYNHDIYPRFKRLRLTEISADDIRALCERIKARNAPATALQVRDVIKGIFDFAALNGYKIDNPAAEVSPKSIARFTPRDRALSPLEVQLLHRAMERIQATADHRLAIRFLLLTMVRKGELVGGLWTEVDFERQVWTIPKERMKARRPHNVYLSRQTLQILTALKACAGSSPYILPSRNNPNRHIANGSLNRLTQAIVGQARANNMPLGDFTVHDLRRTGSTLLNEVGFNGDWIEKCLAHEQGRSSRGVYNKAQYADQRRHMLQEWADMVDAWAAGKSHTPALLPDAAKAIAPEPIAGRSEEAAWASA